MIAPFIFPLAWLATLFPAPATAREPSGGPYCGIFCVYAAAKMTGVDVPFEQLLQQQYVGSYRGSSVAELELAITDHRLHATPLSGLTIASLRSSRHPVILHVRRPGPKMPYAHWVLYAGEESGQARIVDPPNAVELVPYGELAALWDGIGVVVSPEPLSTTELRLSSWIESGILLGVVALFLGVVRFLTAKRDVPWIVKPLLLFMVAVAAGVTFNLIHPEGLLHNRGGVAHVAAQHFTPELQTIGTEELRTILGQHDVAIVDARVPRDYHYGHIPGALNLPVMAGLTERRSIQEQLPRDGTIVVYCQSEHCTWGEIIAADLYHRGYVNVRIYRPGWRGWYESQ